MEKEDTREIRKKYETFSIKIGKLLSKTRLTPNQFTTISLMLAIIMLYFLYNKNFLIGTLLFAFVVIFDIVDGSVARATDRVTKFGKVLDHTIDRYVEFLYILGLAIGNFVTGWIALFASFGIIAPSYVRARGESECGISGAGKGFFERKEKLGTIFGGAVLYFFEVYKDIILDITLLTVGIFSHITAFQRLYYYRKKCKG